MKNDLKEKMNYAGFFQRLSIRDFLNPWTLDPSAPRPLLAETISKERYI
jgi:hypothetical protein